VTAPEGLLAALRGRFGPQVALDLRTVAGPMPLFPAEAAALSRAIPARLAEFSTGRACARAAMAALGLPEAAVPMGPDRAPVWPAGVLGSISHGAGICAAMVARSGPFLGLGLDIETDAPLPPDVVGTVLQGDEAAVPEADQRVVFSVKEAVYKAFYGLSGTVWSFDAVRVELTGAGFIARLAVPVPGWPPARAVPGHVIRRDGVIVTALALEAVE
jgi:4'-phosphopantetheinyl transferase EntD